MIPTRGFATTGPKAALAPFQFQRREPGADDVAIDIQFCGVCHSDIHQARDEWGGSTYPMVPGHEIVGRVSRVGANVKRFKAGDTVGVGCFVDSCRTCGSCKAGLEQYCDGHLALTYNGTEKDGATPTQGGYSDKVVVDHRYVLKVRADQDLSKVAPLLCAGITTYSPLRRWKVGEGHQLAVVGLGGLGHMGVKLGAALGAEVTVLSTSRGKEADARRLGAKHFHATGEAGTFEKLAGTYDFILDTVSAPHDMNAYLGLLKVDGTLILVGVPERPFEVKPFSIIPKRRSVSGSMIGGIAETQEMLDFCAERKIGSDVEVIPIQEINEAYGRMLKNDVRYRFVIDMKSLG